MKWGHSLFPGKRGQTCLSVCLLLSVAAAAGEPTTAHFTDGFEQHVAGQLPGAPWKEETYKSGAVIAVDRAHAFSGAQALHVSTPRGAKYRRGYVAIHLGGPLPQLQSGMYGRAMVWLENAPAVQWTLLQGEGRSADNRYNSIYRLGFERQSGTEIMANFETTPPVTTDCKQHSAVSLPARRWACVEWHMAVAGDRMQFWLDGRDVTRVAGRAAGSQACRGDDLGGRWVAPPRFDSLYMGLERYGDTADDQDLWIDDVVLSRQRIGCPAPIEEKR